MDIPFQRQLGTVSRAALPTLGQTLCLRPELQRAVAGLDSVRESFGVWAKPPTAQSVVHSVGDDASNDLAPTETIGARVLAPAVYSPAISDLGHDHPFVRADGRPALTPSEQTDPASPRRDAAPV